MKEEPIVLNAVRIASFMEGYKAAQVDMLNYLTAHASDVSMERLHRYTLLRVRALLLKEQLSKYVVGALESFIKNLYPEG